VSPRLRAYLVAAACAAAAAGLTVGLTLATRTSTPHRHTQSGLPPLLLDLGVRTDAEAVALRRASNLYDRGEAHRAGLIFDRYRSLEAQVGAALSVWDESIPVSFRGISDLARTYPRSSLVQLEYGLALFWRGDAAGAEAAWRTARRAEPDTPYAIHAEDLLHPNFPRGLPNFVPSFRPPPVLARLSPPKQLAFLRAQAPAGVRGRLLYGVALQRLGHQLSALRQFRAAAVLAPADPEAKVAVAVARFDKANPSRTFSRLGPLARRYPRSQSVRFHLGLCLLWLGSVDKAKAELRLARVAGPKTTLGIEAQRFLEQLRSVGTR
jgi:tetratricopeptide (TPR) repeat protein